MSSMGPPAMKHIERPPLITPSASPPPSRFTHRNPDSDGPSPTKRQRFFSTPRLTLPESSAPSSVSRPQSPIDLQKEREASKLRLLDVWAGLAERYSVPVEDDDLVNIRTGKITKDNGFLRKHKTLDFGTIAAPTLGADDDGSEEDEEDEYDVDELDAFADECSNLSDQEEEDNVHTSFKPPGFVNPFASILKAADEEDLRQFMKEEQERKALCGSDIEDYEEYSSEECELSSKAEGEMESDLETSAEPDFEDSEPFLEQGMEGGDEEKVGDEQTEEDLVGSADRPIPLDLDSEDDELDNWIEDEASIVYPVVKAEPSEVPISADEKDGSIDPLLPTEVPVSVKAFGNQNKPTKVFSHPKSVKNAHQLYTPPQSRSSTRSSAAPVIDVIDLSSSTESSPPSASVSQKNSQVQSTRSSSKNFVAGRPTHIQNPNGTNASSKDLATASLNSSTRPNRTTPKPKPYVLLTPRSVARSGEGRSDLPSPKSAAQADRLSSEGEWSENANPDPSKVSKGKGKVKAVDTGPRPRISDSNQHVSSLPSDGQRGSARLQNEASFNNDVNGQIRFKTKSRAQDHKDLVSSKRYSKNTKHHPQKSIVTSKKDSVSSSTHRKRKRASLDSKSGTSSSPVRGGDSEKQITDVHDPDRSSKRASTSRVTIDEERKGGKAKTRSSSRRRETSSGSDSDSELEVDSSAPESEGRFRNNKQQPHIRASVPPALHPYHHMPYPTSHYPPHDYPPVPDPRAQLIITHAMHQLSALVGGSWGPPPQYGDGSVPYTPTRRRHDGRSSVGPFLTPTHHPHPYPYAYDPNFSNATLPPDSSEFESSPQKHSSSRHKSLVKKSRSRGRRVSFNVDEDERSQDVEGHSSPSPKRKDRRKDSKGSSSKKSKSLKSKKRDEESSSCAESDYESNEVRGWTPGPGSDPKRSSQKIPLK